MFRLVVNKWCWVHIRRIRLLQHLDRTDAFESLLKFAVIAEG